MEYFYYFAAVCCVCYFLVLTAFVVRCRTAVQLFRACYGWTHGILIGVPVLIILGGAMSAIVVYNDRSCLVYEAKHTESAEAWRELKEVFGGRPYYAVSSLEMVTYVWGRAVLYVIAGLVGALFAAIGIKCLQHWVWRTTVGAIRTWGDEAARVVGAIEDFDAVRHSATGTTVIRIQRRDGEIVDTAIPDLSDEDRAFLKRWEQWEE